MEIEKLLLEIEKLKEENKRLKELLNKHKISYEVFNNKEYSTAEKIRIYMSYFKGREDAYAEKYVQKDGKKGYAKACSNRFSSLCNYQKYKQCKGCPNEVFKKLNEEAYLIHLQGKKSIGIYPIVEQKYCYFLVIDFDDESFKEASLAYKKECNNIGIDALIEISQSGDGAHVWIFFKEKTIVKNARLLGDYLLTKAMLNNKAISFKSYDRFFPSQDFVDENGYGNCIALPLQGECVRNKKTTMFVDENFNVYSNQIQTIENTKKISELELELLFRDLKINESNLELDTKNIKKINLMKSDFLGKVEIILKNDVFIDKQFLSNKAISTIKRLAVIYNPEFYEKQAKRMSTYGINRVIELYKEDKTFLCLPRCCYDDLIYLLNQTNASYEVNDKRTNLHNIDVSFVATLRNNQQEAVDELLKYNYGLLVAETGSGKTIMGMSVINYIHKPTLILVEKVKLLEQRKERIEEFMHFEPGLYYGLKKKLTGIIDIASIKSLSEDDSIYDKYDTIIGDEIHHIASATYESVIRRFNARHIYGFTATPHRSDHLEKIIYKCVGPVRVILDKSETNFDKILKPRLTAFKNKEEYDLLSYSDLCKELYLNKERNELIVQDVIKEYQNKKNILILTERNEHIELLYQLLKKRGINAFKINGTSKSKDKKIFSEKIKEAENGFIIISTGKYLGEGFDLPSLDTLFLTMPFKWKGLLSQYVGRIQREFEGKNKVIVYDYVDIKCRKFANQFQHRLKEYKKEEFLIEQNAEKVDFIFTYNNYRKQLESDIKNANEVTFMFNYFNKNVLERLIELNKNIKIVTDCELEVNENVTKIHTQLNAVIIDKRIIWYGGINPFAYAPKDGTILRIDDNEYANDILNLA